MKNWQLASLLENREIIVITFIAGVWFSAVVYLVDGPWFTVGAVAAEAFWETKDRVK